MPNTGKPERIQRIRIPLVGSVFSRNWGDSDTLPALSPLDQRFVNVMFKVVKNPVTGRTETWAYKRPGIDTGTALVGVNSPCYTARPSFQYGVTGIGSMVAVYGTGTNTISIVADTTVGANKTATNQSFCSRITEDDTGLAAFIITPSSGFTSLGFVNSGTLIVDADFPGGAIGNFVFKDGYLFVMTAGGRLYNSDLNSRTAWTSTSFLSTPQLAEGSSLALYNNKICAFSFSYITFYENIGNATGSPLQEVQDLRIDGYGLAGHLASNTSGEYASHRVFEANNTVFWVNNPNLSSGPGVYMMDGFKPRKISSPDVDHDLGRVTYSSVRILGIAEFFGSNHLFISTGDQATDYIWAYCIDTGLWSTWESALFATCPAIFNNPENTTGSVAVSARTKEVLIYSGTSIHKFSSETFLSTDRVFTDNSATMTMTIQTGALDFGTNNKKRLNSIRLIGNDPRESSVCGISWSDDDGQTWSTARNVDMNDLDPKLNTCGTFRRRQFRITNSTNAPCELESMELNYEILNS